MLRETICHAYWYLRLAGHRVDPAKNIIYRHRKWHFVLAHDWHQYNYDKYRIKLYVNSLSRRIEHIRIG